MRDNILELLKKIKRRVKRLFRKSNAETNGTHHPVQSGGKRHWKSDPDDPRVLYSEKGDEAEYAGIRRYSTAHPEYLRILREAIERRGAVLVHTRFWAAAGSTADEIFTSVDSFQKRTASYPPNANVNLLLGQLGFPIEGMVDDDLIERALVYPFTERKSWISSDNHDILLLVEENDTTQNRAFYAPYNGIGNIAELHEYLQELRGQRVRICDQPYESDGGLVEVMGYVPHPSGGIYINGPY